MALIDILCEDMDEEILKRMPLWFRILRKAYERQTLNDF